MKILFNHKEGIVSESGNCLLEVESYREDESARYMFENGWIPLQDKWYQCQSARLKLSDISSRRKKDLSKIDIKESGDCKSIIEKAKEFGKFNEDWLNSYSLISNYTFYMDDAAFGIVNFYDNQIFYSTFVWDKSKNNHSYGTLAFYHLIDKFKKDYEYLYLAEYYEEYSYKQNLQGFEYWNGANWISNFKYKL